MKLRRPELERAGLALVDYADLDEKERARLNEYFHRTVFPVLAPLAFDRIYGAWWDRNIAVDAKAAFDASVKRYLAAIS